MSPRVRISLVGLFGFVHLWVWLYPRLHFSGDWPGPVPQCLLFIALSLVVAARTPARNSLLYGVWTLSFWSVLLYFVPIAIEFRDPLPFLFIFVGPLCLAWYVARWPCPPVALTTDERRLRWLVFVAAVQGVCYHHYQFLPEQQPLNLAAALIQALFYSVSLPFLLRGTSSQLQALWRGVLVGLVLCLGSLTLWPWSVYADFVVQCPTLLLVLGFLVDSGPSSKAR